MRDAPCHAPQNLPLLRLRETLLLLALFGHVFGQKQNAIGGMDAAADPPDRPPQPLGCSVRAFDWAVDLKAGLLPAHYPPENLRREIVILQGNDVRESWNQFLRGNPEQRSECWIHRQQVPIA